MIKDPCLPPPSPTHRMANMPSQKKKINIFFVFLLFYLFCVQFIRYNNNTNNNDINVIFRLQFKSYLQFFLTNFQIYTIFHSFLFCVPVFNLIFVLCSIYSMRIFEDWWKLRTYHYLHVFAQISILELCHHCSTTVMNFNFEY